MPLYRLPARGLLACLVLLLGFTATGCDHGLEPDGPNLIDRFGPFRLVTPLAASQPTADFASGESVVFTAEFNKQVSWVLTITGQESGAVKVIEGFSSALNAQNATWRGGTTELPFFKDEPVDAVLTIPTEEAQAPEETTANVEVLTARVYPGNVFEDFEDGADVFFGNFEFEFNTAQTGITSAVPAGEGDSFYRLLSTGGPVVADPFFIGLVDIRPQGRGVFTAPTTVPDDLYFNFMIRGLDRDFTIAVIQLITDGNGTGQYEMDQDTAFPFGDIPITFDGWRLFSKSVGELGLTQAQAQNIVAVRVVLISDNNAQPSTPLPVGFGIDYITFTAGGPLQP